jgi:hypothetical protein
VIMEEITKLDAESTEVLAAIKALLWRLDGLSQK